jgi:hypothetical protein
MKASASEEDALKALATGTTEFNRRRQEAENARAQCNPHCDKRFKHGAHRHHAVSHRYLAFVALEVGEVLHVQVK